MVVSPPSYPTPTSPTSGLVVRESTRGEEEVDLVLSNMDVSKGTVEREEWNGVKEEVKVEEEGGVDRQGKPAVWTGDEGRS